MELLDHLRTAIIRPGLFRYHCPIFLLSHMRANTSLCGHIFGSHPEIAGYYEMHNGYYSRRSLIRQKLLYYRRHPVKPNARYIFDKVLHDFHFVDMGLVNAIKAKIIFSLREPAQTIKSTVSQFRRERPGHEYCDIETVAAYYESRVDSLLDMASRADEYFYYNADDLRSNSEQVLAQMTEWLGLKSPLSTEFDTFYFSGKGDSGDLSGKLALGRVERKATDYSEIQIPQSIIEHATQKYRQAVEKLQARAVNLNV